MCTTPRSLRRTLALVLVSGATCGAYAQSDAPAIPEGHWHSGTTYGQVNVGRSHFGTSCGTVAGLTCKNAGTAVSLTAGDMFSPNFGAELSYLDFGHADRGGGTVSARAFDLALVGRLPLGDNLEFTGKVGGTYGLTKVDASTDAGLVTGREHGWGVGYGVGLAYHFNRSFSANVEWQRHDLHFAGQGTSPVSMVTAGVGFRF